MTKFEWPCDKRKAHGPHEECPGVPAHPLTQIGGKFAESDVPR